MTSKAFDYEECPAMQPFVAYATVRAAWDMARKACAELEYPAIIVTFVRESASLSQPDRRELQSTAWELSERKRQVSGFTRPGGRTIWINGDLGAVGASHVTAHEILHLIFAEDDEVEIARRAKLLHRRLGNVSGCVFCASA